MPEAFRRGKAYKERSGSGDPRTRGFQFHDHPWVNINIEDTESLMEKKKFTKYRDDAKPVGNGNYSAENHFISTIAIR